MRMHFFIVYASGVFSHVTYILGGYGNAFLRVKSNLKTQSSLLPGFEPVNLWLQGCDAIQYAMEKPFNAL